MIYFGQKRLVVSFYFGNSAYFLPAHALLLTDGPVFSISGLL